MKKRIIYGTKVSVDNMILEAEKEMKIYDEEVAEVFLMGYIYIFVHKESCSALSHCPTNTIVKYLLTYLYVINILVAYTQQYQVF